MRLHFIRNFFRNLNGVKYSTCEECQGPVPRDRGEEHECVFSEVEVSFVVTDLAWRAESSHFVAQVKTAGFLRELTIWGNSYVTAIETVIEEFTETYPVVRRNGIPQQGDRKIKIEFERAEFIVGVKHGSDIHGLYALKLLTNKGKVFEFGNMNLRMKPLNFHPQTGVVGLFGASSAHIDHLGFFLADTKSINFERNRMILLLRYKAKATGKDFVYYLKNIDSYLFRYLAKFI